MFAPAATVIYIIFSIITLQNTLKESEGRAELVGGDAIHYLDIATDFSQGNFSMDYVQRRPHRQPLYPATLAPVMRVAGQNLFWLATVNIGFATLGFLVVYAALLYFYCNRAIAAIVGFLYLTNAFLIEQTTHHFMTEPLHILLMCGAIFAFLKYLEKGKRSSLLLVFVAVSLDYLARPNGLFVLISLLMTLLVRDVLQCFAKHSLPSASDLSHKALLYSIGITLFAAITIPSWMPRLQFYGNPVHHGYLSNYLWVDTYKEGHIGQKYAKYHWQDYVETHSLGDAIRRATHGFWDVCFAIPFRINRHFPILFFLALAGVVIAIWRGPSSYRLLLLFGIIQLLPLIWTHLSNPTPRVPYAATMPFEIIFAAFFLSYVVKTDWFRKFPKTKFGLADSYGQGPGGGAVITSDTKRSLVWNYT